MAACSAILEAAQAAITLNDVSFPTCYGPEYVSSTLITWAEKQGIALTYIQPGKPQQNAYVERYNRIRRLCPIDIGGFRPVPERRFSF